MMVRRYVVKDMPEAIALIRKDLGKDAVILSTKKVTQSKWFGFWRTRRIEVLAATGDGVPTRVDPTQYQAQHAAGVEFQPASSSKPNPKSPQVSTIAQPEVVPQPVAAANPSIPVSDVSTQLVGIEPKGQMTALSEGNQTGTLDASKLEAMYKEISDVKQLLQHKISSPEQDGVRHSVLQYLVRQGVNESQASDWVQAALHVGNDGDGTQSSKPVQELKENLNQQIVDALGDLAIAQPIDSTSRIVALVGPTGVGKTTSIAKLAALHVLEGSRKVGMITTDTFRIAAVDQLRTYANILNVPLQVVYQPNELPAAVNALADCDLILMDTSGRNFNYEQNVMEIRQILTSIAVDETYLVLALTSKPEDLERVTSAFSGLPVDKFLFTKVDETRSYGAILNLLTMFKKPLSYMTTGQSVPDDIEIANIEKILRLIVGGAA